MRIRLHHICLVVMCSIAAGDAFDLSCNSEEVCSAEWDAIGGAQKYLMFFANSTGIGKHPLFVKTKNASRVPLSLPCDAKKLLLFGVYCFVHCAHAGCARDRVRVHAQYIFNAFTSYYKTNSNTEVDTPHLLSFFPRRKCGCRGSNLRHRRHNLRDFNPAMFTRGPRSLSAR